MENFNPEDQKSHQDCKTTLQEVLDVLPETVDISLFTEENDDSPVAVYDGRNSIDIRYNDRKVRFLTVSNGKAEVGVYGKILNSEQ